MVKTQEKGIEDEIETMIRMGEKKRDNTATGTPIETGGTE